MGLSQFIAWATAQGFKHRKFLVKAYNSFKGKFPGKDVILKTARNFYDKAIAKVPTKKITDKIRKDIKTEQIVKKLKPIKAGEKVIVPVGPNKPPFIFTKTPKPKKSAKILQFPKRPPGKADGGRIDKALPTRSRDI